MSMATPSQTLTDRPSMHLPASSLFRAYDVRGIVGESLSAADFLAIVYNTTR